MEIADKLNILKAASEGLLYPSESDEPFKVFCWPRETGQTAGEAVRAHIGEEEGKPVESVPADGFFAEMTDSDEADRFAELRTALERVVPDFVVLRAGRINVSVFLIGATTEKWLGLQTQSVET
jgi:nuclease A inhibitor-like protein